MYPKHKFSVFLLQFLGYLWFLLAFIIIIPFFLHRLSIGFDYVIGMQLGDPSFAPLLMIPQTIRELLSITIIGYGLLIILESFLSLSKETNTFPLSVTPHFSARPDVLVKTSWFAKVRHPMLLGYGVALIGFALFVGSISLLFWWAPIAIAFLLEYNLMIEEPRLVRWFGKEYQEYQKKIPPLVPRFSLSR